MKIDILNCLEDNYAYAISDPLNKKLILVDTPEFGPIDQYLRLKNLRVTDILNTHHHGDHVGANLELKKKFNCTIWGSLEDRERIPGIDKTLKNGENFSIGSLKIVATAVPGHTSHHLIYHLPDHKVLFTGDTLFSMGCGRIFEGTYEQMFASLQKICELPDETLIYCGHEYSEKNARFALSVDPNNKNIPKCTIAPTSLGREKQINPFLRAKTVEEFKKLRKLRDTF